MGLSNHSESLPYWIVVLPVGGSTPGGVGASRDETVLWLHVSGLPHYVGCLELWPLFPPKWPAHWEGNQAAYAIYRLLGIYPAAPL